MLQSNAHTPQAQMLPTAALTPTQHPLKTHPPPERTAGRRAVASPPQSIAPALAAEQSWPPHLTLNRWNEQAKLSLQPSCFAAALWASFNSLQRCQAPELVGQTCQRCTYSDSTLFMTLGRPCAGCPQQACCTASILREGLQCFKIDIPVRAGPTFGHARSTQPHLSAAPSAWGCWVLQLPQLPQTLAPEYHLLPAP